MWKRPGQTSGTIYTTRYVQRTSHDSEADDQIGVSVDGVELEGSHASSSKTTLPAKTPAYPIFLIGMRGAGKTYIGNLAAEVIRGTYTDADDVFAEHTKSSVSDFVEANGWPAFRQTETEILGKLIKEHHKDHIIGLGGGVVESEEARTLLAKHAQNGGVVIHVTRELDAIEGFLDSIGSTAARPKWGEAFADVFKRREPWYQQCSNYEFYNVLEPLGGQSQEDHVRAMRLECDRFFKFILGVDDNRPALTGRDSRPTNFLSLTFPDITPALGQMIELTEGVDAVELRVDLLGESGVPSINYVAKQLSMLRLVTSLPIVYSVRSKDQGGRFPSDQATAYQELVELGLRSGCEYVDLEMAWPTSILEQITQVKQNSHILASWHDWSGKMAWDGQAAETKYAQCAKYGDIVKMVGFANSSVDNAKLQLFAAAHTSKPLLAINMGSLGQLSRVNNTTLTPVTHPLLPSRAAPGQLSAREILQARHLIGSLPAQKFYITGSPISHSMSPTLHNAGFKALGYPHVYERLEYAEVEQGLLDTYNAPDFGGASVTMPLKLKIIPHLHTVSENAKLLGAVNTVVPYLNERGEREFFGDNTDWQAIHEAAKINLDPSALIADRLDVLVIGAGGTCRAAIFAMHTLGATTIYLYNRTLANAESVKSSFPANFNITVIDSLEITFTPSVVVSTVPGESLSLDKSTGIYLDGEVVLKGQKGVAIDLAYKPRKTALMELAKGKEGWKAVSGLEILCLQGFRQFQMWTGKVAPKKQIREAVYGQYNREHPA